MGDIQHIVETCQSLLSPSTIASPRLKASQIGVIAPWREQVWRIRERLRKERLSDVDVGTVEVFFSTAVVSLLRTAFSRTIKDEKTG